MAGTPLEGRRGRAPRPVIRRWVALLTAAASLAATPGHAQAPPPLPADAAEKLKVLDWWVGTWDVTIKTVRPQPSVVTYTETYEWVLDRRFVRGETSRKSDGTEQVSLGTYDQASGGYPFWFFYSTGAWIYLPPGFWDESTRTMEWKHAPNLALTYTTRCVHPDTRTRHCTALVKDWKGSVLLEQEGSAVRRAP